MLAKDADGLNEDAVITTQYTRDGTPGAGNPNAPLNRAQRRAQGRDNQ